jgi:hypothetical protein
MVATVGVRRFQTFIELRHHLAASNAESNEPRPLRPCKAVANPWTRMYADLRSFNEPRCFSHRRWLAHNHVFIRRGPL